MDNPAASNEAGIRPRDQQAGKGSVLLLCKALYLIKCNLKAGRLLERRSLPSGRRNLTGVLMKH